MFSRLINSVRGMVPGQPEQTTTEDSGEVEIVRELRGRKIATPSPNRAKKMVATRRRSGRQSALAGDSPAVSDNETPKAMPTSTPSSSSRKRRKLTIGADEENVTPKSASRRSRRVAERESRESTEDIELSDHNGHHAVLPSSLSQEVKLASDPVDVALVDESDVQTPRLLFTGVVLPATHAETPEVPEIDVTPVRKSGRSKKTPAPKSSMKEAAQEGMASSKSKLAEEPESPPAPAIISKPKHKRFGSEEPVEELVPEAATPQAAENNEDESSDDEAPEVVTANEAEQGVRNAAREAAKAAGLQETSLRQKRKDRDSRLKKQAEDASKKRKATEATENDSEDDMMSGLERKLDAEHSANAADEMDVDAPTKKQRLDRSNLPAFLPAEYLSDTEEASSAIPAVSKPTQRSNKIIFLDEKRPKDVRAGSTTIRIAETGAVALAPKANKRARNMKEEWLQGRPGANGRLPLGGVRKSASSGGFFVNKDKTKKRW